MSKKQSENWLELVPVVKETIGTKFNEDNLVSIVLPRFNKAWMAKLFLRKGKKNEINLQLDTNGTAVWTAINGNKSIQEIIDSLEDIATTQEQFDDRVVVFIQSLYRNGFIKLHKRR